MYPASLEECDSALALIAEALRALSAEPVQSEADRVARHQRLKELVRAHNRISERWREAIVARHGGPMPR